MSTTRLNIRIVGAGLAGLSAAISCAQTGHNVMVLEAAPELAEVRQLDLQLPIRPACVPLTNARSVQDFRLHLMQAKSSKHWASTRF